MLPAPLPSTPAQLLPPAPGSILRAAPGFALPHPTPRASPTRTASPSPEVGSAPHPSLPASLPATCPPSGRATPALRRFGGLPPRTLTLRPSLLILRRTPRGTGTARAPPLGAARGSSPLLREGYGGGALPSFRRPRATQMRRPAGSRSGLRLPRFAP